jgi:ADP-ribose pyrophosphatase YjhB (NUDIX family)
MSSATRVIVSALVIREASILLVEQQGLDDPEPNWMLPGGQVEADESLIAALERELREETGLALDDVSSIAFAVEADAPLGRYSAITFACAASGSLGPGDPDGFVHRVAWVETAEALDRLRRASWYDPAPLEQFLSDGRQAGAVHRLRRS